MSFITELWESVLTPGTTPALVKATHASFILLIISLISLIYLSRSIHFVNLLVIAVLLYAAVVWFIKELEQAKLKSNEELDKEAEEGEKENGEQHGQVEEDKDNTTNISAVSDNKEDSISSGIPATPNSPIKKRKV